MSSGLRLPPGNLGLPVIGESIALASDPERFVRERYARYGPVFKSRIFGHPMVFMVGPEALRFVLLTERDTFASGGAWPPALEALLGDSLMMQDGEEHDRNRAMLNPIFHGKGLEAYLPEIEATVRDHAAHWARQGEIAWYDAFKALTFELATRLLLSPELGSEMQRLGHLFGVMSAGMSPLVPVPLPGTKYRRALAARDHLLRLLEEAVRRRQHRPMDDLVGRIVQAHDPGADAGAVRALARHALLMLWAGHESTTSLLTFACLELARHPDVLQRARAEQHESASGESLTPEALRGMRFLDQVLLETARIHPAFIGSFRKAVRSVEFNGFTIPAGWRVLYSITGTHAIESVFTEPARFDPDRYTVAGCEHTRRPFSHVAFGGGPRICIGKELATLEAKVILSHLLRGYRWELIPGQRLTPVILPTPVPKDHLRVRFARLGD
jgi:cytochrome P450